MRYLVFTTLLIVASFSFNACDEEGNVSFDCMSSMLLLPSEDGSTGDAYDLNNIELISNCLIFTVSYSGGCAEHDFELRYNGNSTFSLPPIVNLTLWHNGNGDLCEAYPTEVRSFDISHFDELGVDEVIITVNNGNQNISYVINE